MSIISFKFSPSFQVLNLLNHFLPEHIRIENEILKIILGREVLIQNLIVIIKKIEELSRSNNN